jgi:uncharacterized protein YkwD
MPRSRSSVTRLGLQVSAVAVGLTVLVGTLPAGAVAQGGTPGGGAVAVRPEAGVAPGWRKQMLARINAVRAAAGVAPLEPCPALRRSAQEYAMLMSTRDHFGHVGPDGSQPQERMRRQGYLWNAVGENIAAGQRSVADVAAAWERSAGHYANLVNPAYRHVGLGHWSAAGSRYGDYWVQDFGRGSGC